MAHGSSTLQPESQRSFLVGTRIHPTLVINASAGFIHVNVGPSGHIWVSYMIHHDGPGRPPKVSFSQNTLANSVTITEKEYPQPTSHANQHTDFTITVPRNTELNFSTGAGDIVVAGLNSRVQLRTHAGSITARSMVARSKSLLSTNAGRIKFWGTVVPGSSCSFHTNAGSLDAYLPSSAHVTVSASLRAGMITSDFSSISIGRTSASGSIGSGPYGHMTFNLQAGTIGIHRQ